MARAGYPAIELAVTASLDTHLARRLLEEHGLTASSLCGLSDPDRDYAHDSPRLRRNAGEYLRMALEQAHELGAAAVIVVATYRPEGDPAARESELERAAHTIAGAAASAQPGGPTIALEALNRYETHLIRTLNDADGLRRRIALPNVELMADVFHMDIEEDSLPEAISAHKDHIIHVHLADNQRREPGSGHLDFDGVFAALTDASYAGALAMEFLPAIDAALSTGREWVSGRLNALAQNVPNRS
ncbi:MAG: TIM barrel protein [Solirubrobacterales bacterium]|nr:TIM barrel protein [Solirubrobacterales bacterium]